MSVSENEKIIKELKSLGEQIKDKMDGQVFIEDRMILDSLKDELVALAISVYDRETEKEQENLER